MIRKLTIITFALTLAVIGFALTSQTASAQTYETVVVQRGDTLAKIGARYCTSWQEIYRMNQAAIGPNPSRLNPGTVLTVPNRCGSPGGGQPGGVYDRGPRNHATGAYQAPYYRVAWGDTLTSIGQRFGVSVTALKQANRMTSNTVYVGQTLLIPGAGQPPARPPTQPPAQPNVERVTFDPGAIAAYRTGTIQNGVNKYYVLAARAGQVMEINTRTHGEALQITVTDARGRVMGLNGENGGLANNLWFTLPASGDYYVTVAPTTPPESPSLTFDITFVIQ